MTNKILISACTWYVQILRFLLVLPCYCTTLLLTPHLLPRMRIYEKLPFFTYFSGNAFKKMMMIMFFFVNI